MWSSALRPRSLPGGGHDLEAGVRGHCETRTAGRRQLSSQRDAKDNLLGGDGKPQGALAHYPRCGTADDDAGSNEAFGLRVEAKILERPGERTVCGRGARRRTWLPVPLAYPRRALPSRHETWAVFEAERFTHNLVGSIRVTESSTVFDTQTDPPPTVMPPG